MSAWLGSGPLVYAEFARKLERDVYEAEREIKDLTLRAQLAEKERDELKAYADKLADGLPDGMLPKDVENLRSANAGLAENLHKVERQRDKALCALAETCETNTEIRRQLEEARQEAERYRRKTLSQDAEIAKLKASSNENYWEVSRQRGNMLHALHEISAAVKRGMKQGGPIEVREAFFWRDGNEI